MKSLKIKKAPNNRTRLILTVFGALLILVTYFLIYLYNTQISSSKKEVLNKLEAVATSASLLIDGNLHQQLARKYSKKNAIVENEDDSLYRKLHQTLNKIYITNHLMTPIYTVVYDDSTGNFEFIGTSSPYPYFRHTYKQYPQKLLTQFDQGGRLDMYRSENGIWLSAFAPIKNSEGKTVALVQADREFGSFIQEARLELFKNIAITIGFFLLIAVLLYFIIKSILDQEERYKNLLIEQHDEIKNKNEEIEVQNNIILKNNNELEEAKRVIEDKNHKLKTINTQLDQKVKQRTLELKRANENLATFLYRSSHDIMGPVATLKGLTNLALIEIKDSKTIDLFHKINDSTNQLKKIIKSINAIFTAKLAEARDGIVPLQEVRIFDLVKDIVQKEYSGYKDFIEIKGDPAAATVVSNHQLLESIVFELISNAINNLENYKFIKPEIILCIKLSNQEDSFIIEITDNGPEIPKEIIKLLTDQEVDVDYDSKQPGMGFYIIKCALNSLQGTINIQNNQKGGKKVILTIPFGNKITVYT